MRVRAPVILNSFFQVLNILPTGLALVGKRDNYCKDRCAFITKSQQAAAQATQAVAAQSLVSQSTAALLSPSTPTLVTSGCSVLIHHPPRKDSAFPGVQIGQCTSATFIRSRQ